jgi:hypothetical protein
MFCSLQLKNKISDYCVLTAAYVVFTSFKQEFVSLKLKNRSSLNETEIDAELYFS